LVRAAGFSDGEGVGVTELEGVGVLEGVSEGVGVLEGVSEGVGVLEGVSEGVFEGDGEGVDETPGAAHTVSLVSVQPAAVTLQVVHVTQPPAAAAVPVELHVEPATQACAALEGDGVGVDEEPGAAHTVSLVGVQPAAVMGHVLHARHPPAAALVPVELHVEPATQACATVHTASAVAVQGLT
jgi:hypothetical protein